MTAFIYCPLLSLPLFSPRLSFFLRLSLSSIKKTGEEILRRAFYIASYSAPNPLKISFFPKKHIFKASGE